MSDDVKVLFDIVTVLFDIVLSCFEVYIDDVVRCNYSS